MFQLLPSTNVDFMKGRKIAYVFSGLLILAGIVLLIVRLLRRPASRASKSEGAP